jgi:hypothetical protein
MGWKDKYQSAQTFAGSNEVPEGTYHCRLIKSRFAIMEKGSLEGHECWKWAARIVGPSHVGVILDGLRDLDDDNNLGRFKGDMAAMGLGSVDPDNLSDVLLDMVDAGAVVEVEVRKGTSTDRKYARIVRLVREKSQEQKTSDRAPVTKRDDFPF